MKESIKIMNNSVEYTLAMKMKFSNRRYIRIADSKNAFTQLLHAMYQRMKNFNLVARW